MIDKDLFEDIRNTKDRVEYVLKKYPETRNSDQELVQRVADVFQLDQLKIYETCRRMRQKFQEGGQYLPTIEAVAKQRKMNIETWRKALGYNTGTPGQGVLI